MHTPSLDLKINKIDVAFMASAASVLFLATVLVNGKRPLWYDEIYSWTLITDPSFRHMMYALWMAAESPPGLYHVLARMWLAVTGPSTLALRLFSTFAGVVAIVAIWTTLRRAFSLRATALGVLTVFCTSAMMLFHSAEARFYPLFVACVALAIAAYARAIEARELNWRLGAALFFSNLALVQAHIYGIAYSAALLFALICCDIAMRRVRPLVYACMAGAWLSLLPWLPTLHRVNEQTKPRHWIMPPTLPGVVEFYRLYSLEMPMILFAVAILCFVARALFADQSGARSARHTSLFLLLCLIGAAVLKQTYPSMFDIALLAVLITLAARGVSRENSTTDRLRRSLLVAAAVLLAAPPAAAIFSLLVKPVFIPKYVLPSMLGMAILLAWIVETGSRFPLKGRRAALIGAGWAGLLIAMLAMPLLSAVRESTNQPPQYGIANSDVESLVPQGLPVAVENYFLFLPLQQGTRRADKPYFYVGDREAASAADADRSALLHYRGAELWKSLGYLSDNAPDWHDFLATHTSFAVLHSPGHFWFKWRVRDNPDYTWRSVGMVGEHEVVLVERKNSVPSK
jgi:hypothetical protein